MNEFERCWPFLERALKRGLPTHSKEDVWAEIADGTAQLWPLPNAAIVTRIVTYPTGLKIGVGWLAGGDLKEIQQAEPEIAQWLKGQGCSHFVLQARTGWERALNGYRRKSVNLIKDL